MYQQLVQGLGTEMVSKIHFVAPIDDFDWTKIDRGMISCHASWSGYSLLFGKAILNSIEKYELEGFQIYLIDIDRFSTVQQIELFGNVCQGYFETVWIENGLIEFTYQDNNMATETMEFKNFLERGLGLHQRRIK